MPNNSFRESSSVLLHATVYVFSNGHVDKFSTIFVKFLSSKL